MAFLSRVERSIEVQPDIRACVAAASQIMSVKLSCANHSNIGICMTHLLSIPNHQRTPSIPTHTRNITPHCGHRGTGLPAHLQRNPEYKQNMKHSTTKKRRLAALNQNQGHGSLPTGQDAAKAAAAAAAAQQAQQPQAAQSMHVQQQPPSAAANSEPTCTTGATITEELGSFPYNQINSTITAFQAALRQQLAPTSSCKGSVDDILEQLMTPNMPPYVARAMIATRTVDKSVVLDNPTAKLNITRPSNSHKGRRQLLAAKLLPRAQRQELSRLPSSGFDFAALTGLHELWGKYMIGLLEGKPDAERLLQTADWHGAIMTVTSSSNKIYTGRSGIVMKATSNTFVLVGTDGRSSVVPLKGAVLECVVPGMGLPVVLQGSSSAKLNCTVASKSVVA